MITVTLQNYPGGRMIRLAYGIYLVLGINGKASGIDSIHMVLFKDRLKLPWLEQNDLSLSTREHPITRYRLSCEDFKNHESTLINLFEETMHFAAERLRGRKGGKNQQHNNTQLASAILQPELQEKVLAYGL
jgi:hypothetical protein